MKQSTMIVILVAVVLVVGGGAFYGGMKYGENRIMQDPAALFQQMQGGMGGQFPGGGTRQPGTTTDRTGGGLTAGGTLGTIQKIDGDTIVLSTENDTIEVITSETTFIQKMMDVGTEALEVGESVIVTGSENADGSISARSIRSAQGMRSATSDQ